MLSAVQFDDETRFGTEEVDDIIADGRLSAELKAVETLVA
jgi:hypothetical protein